MNGKLVVLAATVALAGCGAPAVQPESLGSSAAPAPSSAAPAAPSSSSPSASASPSRPATSASVDRRPSGPPKGPTDQIKTTAWVVGTVTADSSGPCYTLTTDEGTQYALHSTAGTKFAKGTRVRVKTAPAKVRIYCGPGQFVEMVSSELLR